jgi:hypothetical protein
MFLDAKLPHVLSRQAWQHRVVNVFLAESRLVLLAAQDPRPAPRSMRPLRLTGFDMGGQRGSVCEARSYY